ncbi:hypothetical protein HD600_001126 [Microbacterium ginsengiterrae]|uniref:Uncharacterized protein n=1 Tax=Microbacterium ginsengiterrae TaxID=546115 RepID=A0A7W9CBQ0_9MICO|nr:hypothetical protein [Microbacterium ginsengiterrae]MBB5742629.1 hypothetical protein [Microbacterium ginsengiterrae]
MKQPSTTRARRRLRFDLTALAVVGVLLIGALGASVSVLYTEFYGPSAFVTRYLDLLATGRAADALHVPGVSIDRTVLEESDIDETASEALLREAALAPLTEIDVVSEEADGEIFSVTVAYLAGGHRGSTTFQVQQDGWAGVTPNWRFAQSPLAAVSLSVLGADRFAVNGFEVHRAQVSAAGVAAEGADPLPMLVFTPGLYSVTVDTAIATSPGVSVLADSPLAQTSVELQTEPTEEFVSVVQTRVEEFLTECTTQQVLQPTACPFGLEVRNRILDPPVWSISQQPEVTVHPDGAQWKIPPTEAVAHIEVDIRSLFDGSVEHVSEDVPFRVDGTITILPDGSASIRVGSPGA